ncbi:MAG: proline dehydrogenase [Labilithrix sp.]|nr:proline dehydrogenase [Labilithrix sp.]MCW5818135.1 proline dehydrogenase [Labilithrix sp.]
MSRGEDDIRALLRAARSVAGDPALREAVVEASGLSRAGVDLAFDRHLELDATDVDLARLLQRAGSAEAVFVVLSSNVFVGALRALALARAAAPEVVVRPSRRDPAFARALVAAVGSDRLRLDESLDFAAVTRGELHVYGTDDTIADVRARAKVPVRGHGAGMGVVWISKRASPAEAARLVADDVVVFDQRGCLSPRIVLVEHEDAVAVTVGGGRNADAFAEALHAELEERERTVPRGQLSAEERAASDRYVATMTYACRALVGAAHAIGIAPAGAPLVPAPAYRHVHVVAGVATEDAARAVLTPLAKAITGVGSDDLEAAKRIAPSWARLASLGAMQRPPLDGPVDLRDPYAISSC